LNPLIPIVLLASIAAAPWCADAAPPHGNATAQSGATPGFDRARALEISQAAIGRTLTDQQFLDVDATPRHLADYRGKPLVISLVYTSCYHICPTTTRHLAEVISRAQSVLGEDSFSVITLGFDAARDTPLAMREFASAQQAAAVRWDFLSGTEASVAALAGELGFQFAPAGGGFDHLLQTTLLDGDGVVRRQVYGMDYDTPVLIEPLKRLVFGEALEDSFLERMTDRFRLFCTVYDPASDSYRFDYSIIVGIAIGAVTGLFFLVLLIREWRYSMRSRDTHE
jgi:protein SCO1/2